MGTGEGGKVEFKNVWRDPSILPNAFIACTGHLYLYTVLKVDG